MCPPPGRAKVAQTPGRARVKWPQECTYMASVWKDTESSYQKFCPPNLKRVPTPMIVVSKILPTFPSGAYSHGLGFYWGNSPVDLKDQNADEESFPTFPVVDTPMHVS